MAILPTEEHTVLLQHDDGDAVALTVLAAISASMLTKEPR